MFEVSDHCPPECVFEVLSYWVYFIVDKIIKIFWGRDKPLMSFQSFVFVVVSMYVIWEQTLCTNALKVLGIILQMNCRIPFSQPTAQPSRLGSRYFFSLFFQVFLGRAAWCKQRGLQLSAPFIYYCCGQDRDKNWTFPLFHEFRTILWYCRKMRKTSLLPAVLELK